MKRAIMVLVIALAVTATVSAQNFIVQSVSGRVQRESGISKVDVTVGDNLSGNTVLHTGLGSSLVLKEGDKTFSVAAGQSGKRVSELVNIGSGIRIGGNVTNQASTGRQSRVTGQTSTAAARASDVAADDDVSAE